MNFYELTIHRSYEVEINYWFNGEIYVTEKIFTGRQNKLIEFNETGYSFNYWETENHEIVKEQVVWEEQNIYANVIIHQYEIILDTNGGEEIGEKSIIMFGQNFTMPIPIREGYTFIGWFIDSTPINKKVIK